MASLSFYSVSQPVGNSNRDGMSANGTPQPDRSDAILQLLLFFDKRLSPAEQIRRIRQYMHDLQDRYAFALQEIDVAEQPYLAEHFKLIATPALIKIHPDPRQTVAGNNLVSQLEHWWPRWQRAVEDYRQHQIEMEASSVSEGKRDRSIASVTNSAELMQLSDEVFRLQRENEELQEQLRFKERLIAMLAHDLRNPLTAASIALETLETTRASDNGSKTAKEHSLTAQLIQHARVQTRSIERMISDVLQASRSASAQFCIHPQKVDLQDLCEEVLDRFQEQFQTNAHNLETDIPNDLPNVYADRERVRQVLINLLDNAIKYTPKDGTIRVSVLHRTTQKVQLSVCDDGPGIPNENQQHIFEDRFRLKRDETKDGYGIGLSLCKRIIQAHYGQIWVDSAPKQGSCFHFTLPVYR